MRQSNRTKVREPLKVALERSQIGYEIIQANGDLGEILTKKPRQSGSQEKEEGIFTGNIPPSLVRVGLSYHIWTVVNCT